MKRIERRAPVSGPAVAELLSVVRRLVASGTASSERGEQAIDDLIALPIERYPHDALVRRAWDYRENFSAYDATYLALAEALAPEPGARRSVGHTL